jgi:hypothetical protein
MLCERFAHLVEHNALSTLLYTGSGKLRHERFAHILFYAVADRFCDHYCIDITREANAGLGPVDFKLSRGSQARVLVEVKYSNNSRLIHGYTTQLDAYRRAEQPADAIYLVLKVGARHGTLTSLLKLHAAACKRGDACSGLIVADATTKKSASKR